MIKKKKNVMNIHFLYKKYNINKCTQLHCDIKLFSDIGKNHIADQIDNILRQALPHYVRARYFCDLYFTGARTQHTSNTKFKIYFILYLFNIKPYLK